MLGLCPTLAVTTSAMNGLGMGLSSTVVLVAANFIISLMRSIIPGRVRLPGEIVVVASLVTIVDMLMEGFTPDLYSALGIYIPLIVVNCIILGRAEAYASKNKPLASLFDGIGMGLGFTVSITCIGAVRELIGAGTLFGHQILPLADSAVGKAGYEPRKDIVIALDAAAQVCLPYRTALRWELQNGGLTPAIRTAREAVLPAEILCAGEKEVRSHERIVAYYRRLCPCK